MRDRGSIGRFTKKRIKLIRIFSKLLRTDIVFSYFLNENGQANKEGPFQSGMNRMINEEKSICKREQSHRLNRKLYGQLEKLNKLYNTVLKEMNSIDECSYLKSICSRIEGMKQMPMIYEQLNPAQQ